MQRLDKADFWFDCDGGFLVDQSRNLGGEGFDSGGGVAGVDEHQGLILVQPHCSTAVAAPIADMVEHPPKRDFVATEASRMSGGRGIAAAAGRDEQH